MFVFRIKPLGFYVFILSLPFRRLYFSEGCVIIVVRNKIVVNHKQYIQILVTDETININRLLSANLVCALCIVAN